MCCELQQVRDWYVTSFKDLRSFPEIQDMDDESRFTNLISRVKARHNEVMPTMAMGIQELKEDLGRKVGLNELPEIHEFLDRFYMSRIGIRMLIGEIFIITILLNLFAPKIMFMVPALPAHPNPNLHGGQLVPAKAF